MQPMRQAEQMGLIPQKQFFGCGGLDSMLVYSFALKLLR